MKFNQLVLSALLACISIQASHADEFAIPEYLKFEEVESQEITNFVEPLNQNTLNSLEAHPEFNKVKEYIKNGIVKAREESKLESASFYGEYAYNYYTDDINVKGVMRRILKSEFKKAKKENTLADLKWEVVINFDEFIKTNRHRFPVDMDPSYEGKSCFYDKKNKVLEVCLIQFSHTGGDAKVAYEFDFRTGKWIDQNAFEFAYLNKSSFSYVDRNNLAINLDELALYNHANKDKKTLDEAAALGMVSVAGYPINSYVWKRGEQFSKQNILFKAAPGTKFGGYWGNIEFHGQKTNKDLVLFYQYPNYYEYDVIVQIDSNSDGQYSSTTLDLPKKFKPVGFRKNLEWYFMLNHDWKEFKAYDVIRYDLKIGTNDQLQISKPTLFYRNQDGDATVEFAYMVDGDKEHLDDDRFFIVKSKNITNEITMISQETNGWEQKLIPNPKGLKINRSYMWEDNEEKRLKFFTTSFLTPSTIYNVDIVDGELAFTIDEESDSKFDESQFKEDQLWIEQKDEGGNTVRVPYFIVYDPSKVSLTNNKNAAPVFMYAYGGFASGMRPFYLGNKGKLFLEKGGVYVLANIRGGNEFGTQWHEASLLEKRENTYSDFIKIAEDLIARGITSPQKLGIIGGSNGGLLMGVAMTQRPDLFAGIISDVPLLDMKRYHLLSQGANWMDEYGDPTGAQKALWDKFSPLHNLKDGTTYPKVFIRTNKHDDRVHPAHARKFAYRLQELGQDFYYYEDPKGGHGGDTLSSEEEAYRGALDYIYLYETLGM